MITILFHMTVKTGREQRFAATAKDLASSTRAEDNGCIGYVFYRQTDNPRQFVLYEQWRDQQALAAPITRLQHVFGPPDDQEPDSATHHRRRLPKAFLELFEKTDAVRYEALE